MPDVSNGSANGSYKRGANDNPASAAGAAGDRKTDPFSHHPPYTRTCQPTFPAVRYRNGRNQSTKRGGNDDAQGKTALNPHWYRMVNVYRAKEKSLLVLER